MAQANVCGWTVSLTLVALLAGCAADGSDALPERTFSERTASARALTFLPPGVPVGPDVELSAPPQPLEANDYAAGERARPNSMARLNLANSPRIPRDFGRRRGFARADGRPVPPPGQGDRGFWVHAGQGLYAGNDLEEDLTIPDATVGATVYAPTHLPAGGTCIETTTAHWRYEGSAATAHGHGFWDWCRESPGWGVFEEFSDDWKAKYARSQGGELAYYTMVQQTEGDCWTGSLYDFSSGHWESKLSSCGTTKSPFGNTGWTMWESWDLVGCPEFPSVQATSILIFDSAGWTGLLPAHTTALGPDFGTCFEQGHYLFDVPSPNDAWIVDTL